MFNIRFSHSSAAVADSSGEKEGEPAPEISNPMTEEGDEEETSAPRNAKPAKKKRTRRRRKTKSRARADSDDRKSSSSNGSSSKKHHDAPMTKRDLYFALHCEMVGIGQEASAVARVSVINWAYEVVLDTFVQVPVPITDYRETGIDAADIYDNPSSMTFASVRQVVERILRGKILIGHNLKEHLTALGLTHPWTDVRDSALYEPFCYEEVDGVTHEKILVYRDLIDLCTEVLNREFTEPRKRPLEYCVAVLDLYKSHRKNWEQHLIAVAQQKENLREQVANLPPHLSCPPSMIEQQIPDAHISYTQHTGPATHAASRARASSYDGTPQAGMSVYNHYSIPPTSQPQHQPQQQPQHPRVPYESPHGQQAKAQSTWFSRSRKQRPATPTAADVVAAGPTPPVAAPVLSTQALQVLDSHYSIFDRSENSSTYCSSTPHDGYSDSYEGSTDYESSTPYEGSALSESDSFSSSLNESSESVSEPSFNRGSEQSSWFRFGSRREPFSQRKRREPMTSVEELEEIEEACEGIDADVEELLAQSNQGAGEMENDDYELDGTHADDDGIEAMKQSSWFGFRRSKSPGASRRRVRSPAKADEAGSLHEQRYSDNEEISDSSRHQSVNLATLPQSQDPKQQDIPPSSEKSSSWFNFRRPRSPLRRRNSQEHDTASGDQANQPNEGSENFDEDWLNEIMSQPSVDVVLSPAAAKGRNTWTENKSNPNVDDFAADYGERGSKQRQSTWFRFLKSPKSTGRRVSRLPSVASDDDDVGGEHVPTAAGPSSQRSTGLWEEHLVAEPSDSNQPMALQFRNAQAPPEFPPLATRPMKDTDVDYNRIFSRSRLCTESTIQTVPTESEEDDLSEDFVQGMEHNLAFLEI